MSLEKYENDLRKQIALSVYPVIVARHRYAPEAAREAVTYANALIVELSESARLRSEAKP